MEIKPINEILAEARELTQAHREYEQEAQTEALRQRSLPEAQALIEQWKKLYKRKTKVMRISIIARFFPSPVSKTFYKLRLFYANNCEAIYNLEDRAAQHLINGVKRDEMPGIDYYTLYDSHEI